MSFLLLPPIRIHGRDIELEVKERGDELDYRVWGYEEQEYNEPPKTMIFNAMLREVYGDKIIENPEPNEYVLPSNLKVFLME